MGNKIIRERILKLTERILKLTDGKDYGLCSTPMNAQVALNELCRYFLGENWYTTMPESQEQVNTEIVYEIEAKYRGYREKGISASEWLRGLGIKDIGRKRK